MVGLQKRCHFCRSGSLPEEVKIIMGYRSYSTEHKIKFLDLLKENRSVATSAREVGVIRSMAANWIGKEKNLRLEYERFLRPIQSEEENQNTNNRIPLEGKIQCI